MERGAVTATGVIFQQVIGVDTPLNPGTVLFCFPANCELNFTTGPSTGLEGPPIWTFDGGGTVSMTGGLNTAADGSGTQILPGGSILVSSGSFGSPEVENGTESNLMFTGSGTDTKNTTLAGFYGLANPFTFVTTELSLGRGGHHPRYWSIHCDGDRCGLPEHLSLQIVPLPPSGLLVGLGLLLMRSARALRRFV
jgi:hypothetical protein